MRVGSYLAGALCALLMVYGLHAKTGSLTWKRALGALRSAQGEELKAAMDFIAARPELSSRQIEDLRALLRNTQATTDVASRLIVTLSRRPDGCRVMARLVPRGPMPLVDLLVARGSTIPWCQELEAAIVGLLDRPEAIRDPNLLARLMALARSSSAGTLPEGVCAVASKPSYAESVRRDAIAAILNRRPKWAPTCLVNAYNQEQRLPRSPVRRVLLKAVSDMDGPDSVPTLVMALRDNRDHDLACAELTAKGERGVKGMVFALRTARTPPKAIEACLTAMGSAATNGLFSLLDHPSSEMRHFILSFLANHPTKRSAEVLIRRFEARVFGITPLELLRALARHPPGLVNKTFEGALDDPKVQIRLAALTAIEQSRLSGLARAVLRTAEEDSDRAVRSRALEVAWHLGLKGTGKLALRMVQYEEPSVAVTAYRVLSYMGPPESVEVLRTLYRKKYEKDVSQAAGRALWLLTFEPPDREGRFRPIPEPKSFKGLKKIELDGGKAWVGGDEEPLVVMLPGGPGLDQSWAWPFLEDLTDDATVAYVQPDVPTDDSMPFCTPELLRRLLRKLGRSKAVLVSQGVGGSAALWLASRAAGLVAGVVAISAPLPGHWDDYDKAVLQHLPKVFAEEAQDLASKQQTFASEALGRYMARALAPGLAGHSHRPWPLLGIRWHLLRLSNGEALLSRPDMAFSVAELQMPVVFVLPGDILTKEAIQRYRLFVKAGKGLASLKVLEGCGLHPQVTCTDDIVDLIQDFSERLFEK